MNEQFTPELLASARTAETPEVLLTLAAENGVTLTLHEAQAHFDLFHQTGELSDEELDNVAGGGCKSGGKMMVTVETRCANPSQNWLCNKCGKGTVWEWDCDYSGISYQKEVHRCKKDEGSRVLKCNNCKHCTYERGLWLCNNPAAYC